MSEFEMNERRNKLFANWLKNYTHDVIMRVMEQRDEITQNEHAMKLLEELYEREQAEAHDFERSIDHLFSDFETFKEYNPHNHALSHSGSYRSVLYDMYIHPVEYKDGHIV